MTPTSPTRARHLVTAFAVALAAITYIDRVSISVSALKISIFVSPALAILEAR